MNKMVKIFVLKIHVVHLHIVGVMVTAQLFQMIKNMCINVCAIWVILEFFVRSAATAST